jgi:hypothetical protein
MQDRSPLSACCCLALRISVADEYPVAFVPDASNLASSCLRRDEDDRAVHLRPVARPA